MTTVPKTKTIRFLEVDATPGPAKYSKEVDVDSTEQDHRKKIDDAAKNDKLPAGRDRTPPKSGLDIDVGHATGTLVLAVRLPEFTSKSELVFLSPPVVALPSNLSVTETYLSNIRRHAPREDRWASFECDLDWLRESELAKQIGAAALAIEHKRTFRIPFMLNVLERKLGCAPWMVPVETSNEHVPLLTHGGPHPMFASYLIVDI